MQSPWTSGGVGRVSTCRNTFAERGCFTCHPNGLRRSANWPKDDAPLPNSDVAADVALAALGTTQLNTRRYADAMLLDEVSRGRRLPFAELRYQYNPCER
jgi:hypothetical protein